MKLLMISGDRSLAQGRRGAFYNTLEEFQKYWTRIDIINPQIRNPKSETLNKSQIQNSKLQTIRIFDNVYIHPSPWPLVFQPWWILKKGQEIYREQKFDLMTVHEYPPFYNGIGARMLSNKIRVPYVLEIHHVVGYPKPADLKEKVYKNFTRLFIKFDASKAKAVRVVNQKQVPEFLIKAGVPKEKIIYIPSLYIDLEIFKPLGLPKKYDLIFVGRLVKNKGVDLLIDVFKILHSTYYLLNSKLLIVGDGPLREKIKLKIENQSTQNNLSARPSSQFIESSGLKLQDNVLLYGWAKDQKEIAELLNQSKILVMPSYNEGGPRVLLEAMACGVPVLATPVGIAADIIKDGHSGRVIKWNAADIAEKANSLLNNRSEYEKYSQAGIRISRRFEKSPAIKNYAEKLRELI